MKTVLITGASRGIGAAAAEAFAAAGYAVAVNYRTEKETAEQLCSLINARGAGSAVPVYGDVSDPASAAMLVSEAERLLGGLDVLVCNAGISRPNLFTDITDAEWREVFSVNVDGMFYAIRAALPGMIHRKSGRIVTVSSMWGVTGGSCEVAYSASKAAVIGLTRALAKEVGPSGITVNCVAPGVIDTVMNANLDAAAMDELKEETPLMRIGSPSDVADAMVFLASDRAAFITGQVLNVDGGMVIG